MRERVSQMSDAGPAEESGVADRPRDEQGRFKAQPEQTATEEGPAEESGIAETGTVAEGAAKEAPPPVRVPLPDSLRAQGLDSLPTSPEHERIVRALVNGYTRREQIDELQRELMYVKAERDQALSGEGIGLDPRQMQLLADVEADDRYGPEDAKEFREALLREKREKLARMAREKAEQEYQQTQAQRMEQRVLDWEQQAYQEARRLCPGIPDDVLQESMRVYGAYMTARPDLQVQGEGAWTRRWKEHVMRDYVRTPAGQKLVAEYQKQKAAKSEEGVRAQAKEEAAQAERQRLEEAARKRRQNPLGSVPVADTGARTMSPESPEPDKSMTASQRQRAGRARIRALFARE